MVSANDRISSALEVLKKTATKGKTKKPVLDTISSLSSSLVLLNSSTPSLQAFSKLTSVLRHPFVPLYAAYPDQALSLAASILKLIIDEHLSQISNSTYDSGFPEAAKFSKEGWEKAIYALLSGILDFLEDENTEQSKTFIANRFYKTICGFFFASNNSNPGNIGSQAKSVAYSILSDTCVLHGENQSKLRDSRLLGPKRLGMTIRHTKDYVSLENLLTLFAQLLPSTTSSDKRAAFIRATFVSTKLFPSGDSIVNFLKDIAAKDWEIAATKIVDELAASDKSFPQPFNLDELSVCGHVFPQPEPSDRLYLDRDTFLANVLQEDGMYETLLIKYGAVKSIDLTEDRNKNKTRITIELTSSPLLADQPLHIAAEENHSDPRKLNVIVEIAKNDVTRFTESSKLRGLGYAFHSSQSGLVHPTQRISISVTEANLDHEQITKDGVEAPSRKVEKVEKFYEGSDDAPIAMQETIKPSVPIKKDIVGEKDTKTRKGLVGQSVVELTKAVEPPKDGVYSANDASNKEKFLEAEGYEHVEKPQSTSATDGLQRENKVIIKQPNSNFQKTEQLPKNLSGITKINMSAEEPIQLKADLNESSKRNPGKSKSPAINDLPKERDSIRPKADVSKKSKRAAASAASAKIAVAMHDSADSWTSETKELSVPKHVNERETPKDSSAKKTGDAKKLNKVKLSTLTKSNNINLLATKHTDQQESNVDDMQKSSLLLAKSKQLQETEKSREKGKQADQNKKRKRDEADTLAIEESKALSKRKKENISPDTHADELITKKRADSSALFSRNILTPRSTHKYGNRARKIVASPISPNNEDRETPSDSIGLSDVKERFDFDDIPGKAVVSASRTAKNELGAELMSTKAVLKSSSSPECNLDGKGVSRINLNSKSSKLSGTIPMPMKSKITLPFKIDNDGLPVMESVQKIRQNKADIKLRAMKTSVKESDSVAHIENFISNVNETGVLDTEDMLEEVTLFNPFERNDHAVGQKEELELLRFQYNSKSNITSGQSKWNTDEISPTKKANRKGAVSSKSSSESPPFSLDVDLERAMNTPRREKTEKQSRNIFPAVTLSSEVEHSDSAIAQSTPTSKPIQKPNIIFIDLTTKEEATKIGEDSKTTTRRTPKNRSQDMVDSRTKYDGYPVVSSVTEPTSKTTPSRPTVTFDPVPHYKQPSFDISMERGQFESAVKRTLTSRKDERSGLDESLIARKIRTGAHHSVRTPTKRIKTRVKEPEMDEIINVLNAITDTIVQNIARKSEVVQQDVRISRDRLLRDAVADLGIMKQDSIQHFDKMLALETEYARFNRKVLLAQEVIGTINQEICSFAEQTIKDHDRNMLSKKLPGFLLPLPAIFKL